MASKPIKLPKDTQGQEYYPATTTEAVVDRKRRKSLADILNDIDKTIQNVEGGSGSVPTYFSVGDLPADATQGSLATVIINTEVDGEEVSNTYLYIKTAKGWTRRNDVQITDSADKLNEAAPLGSIATVSNLKIEEIEVEDKFSVRDIYVEENPDCEPLMELKVKVPEVMPTTGFSVFCGPKGYSNYSEVIAGKYFALLQGINGVNIQVSEDRSITLSGTLVSNSTINEDVLTQLNEIIASWEGIVLYGGVGVGSGFSNITDEQIAAIDSFIGYDNTHTETVETHTNDIYFKETTGWRKINDVKIVDSIDKLDANAPQGSLASVANTLREIKWSEVYQPTEEELNQPFADIVGKLTRISKFEVTPPESMDDMPDLDDMCLINFFSGTGSAGFFTRPRECVGYFGEYSADYVMEPYSEDDVNYTWEVYHDIINAANEELNKTPFYYVDCTINGEPTPLPSFLDDIIHIYTGEVSTELYIKTDKGWTPYKESDTVYIDYNALDVYDKVNYDEGIWYYEIPIDEFPKVSRGVPFDELIKYKHIAFEGNVEPLMVDGALYCTPQYIYGDNEIWYGRLLEIFVDGEYVYVGYYIQHMVEITSQPYSSIDELPKDSPIGTIASVLVDSHQINTTKLITKSIDEFNPSTETLYGLGSFKSTAGQQHLSSVVLQTSQGNITIMSGMPGSYLIRITYYSGSNSMYQNDLAYYDSNYSLVYSTTAQGNLIKLNEILASGVKVTTPDTFEQLKNFVSTVKIASFYKKTVLYVRNETGWEQYNEIIDGSVTTEKLADKAVTLDKLSEDISAVIESCPIAVESVDSLPSNVKIGIIASVLETTVEEVTSGGTPHNGLRLKQVEVRDTVHLSMPPNMEFILTAKDGTTIEIRSRGTAPNYTLYFLDPNKIEYVLAAYSLQYSTVEKNTANIDTLNQLLQSNKYYCRDEYFNQSEAQGISSYFKTLVHEKEVYITKVYVKNTAGWEEYDKPTKDKVLALETKVAELEAKIQELLQS